MTKEELERQTEELARSIRDAIDHWDDPPRVAEREAYEAEKEQRQTAIFELTYIRSGQRKPGDSLEVARACAEALANGGTLVAAWDDLDDDRQTLTLFAVGAKGARRLAEIRIPPGDHEAKADELIARGVRIGRTYGNNEHVWVIDEPNATVWSAAAVAFDGNSVTLELAGQFVLPGEVVRVVTFVDANDRGHRGVRLVRVSGSDATVAEEHDPVASTDPLYSQDNLVVDGLWAAHLGHDLAMWLRVPLDDQIGKISNAQNLEISTVARALADEIERLPATGTFEQVYRSLGVVAPAGELVLRFAANPLAPDRRFLELRVSSRSGTSTAGRWIRQGHNLQVAAFLRGPRTPSLILRTMNELLPRLRQDDYL